MPNTSFQGSRQLSEMMKCARKDLRLIVVVTIVFVLIGAVAGKFTNMASSRAQLILTPMPLNQNKTEDDALFQMLAAPLDVTSLSQLCKNDEVLQKTMDKLNELYQAGQISSPVSYITQLNSQLRFRVTVAKETPYEVTYTPLLELTADANAPHDAEVMVNTWAGCVVEAAKKFQTAVQSPAAQALEQRTADLENELKAVEQESEKFWTENNLEYLQARLEDIAGSIVNFTKNKSQMEAELIAERATMEAYSQEVANEKPTIALNWTPSPEVLGALAGKLGVSADKIAPGANAISVEHLNMVYWEIRGKIAAARAGVASKEAEIKELDRLIADLEAQRAEVQTQFAKVTVEKQRLARLLKLREDAYTNIALKLEYAQVAGKLEHPNLQVISQGTTWPMPRFRRAIMLGGIMGIFACLTAMTASVSLRMILRPVSES